MVRSYLREDTEGGPLPSHLLLKISCLSQGKDREPGVLQGDFQERLVVSFLPQPHELQAPEAQGLSVCCMPSFFPCEPLSWASTVSFGYSCPRLPHA